MDGEMFRKASIASKLSKLIVDNPEYTVANLVETILRTKNIRSGEKESYFMSDEDFLVALEDTFKQLKEKVDVDE